ncbi:hypothetical protein HYPSUDRAFT_207977 [Hypholoma sublateritium FD-334 SS-4]|uniref:C2H2-type domain-containing protein n=1 Tax=Hypholoma sublateritium (strain FD-334 SS-4) TaxID=945553 RepID=A0A0D2P4B1_HYPSF|nr:hypothetical protein HYPSUDRAFT_207977 [Hypholoma sublateritium FD-334 SS-4]
MPATRTIERRIDLGGIERFSCPLEGCYVTVARKSDISRHLHTHNPETKLNFPCPAECGHTFRQESNITRHLKRCRAAAKARAKGISFIREKGGRRALDILYVDEQLAEDSFTLSRYSGPKVVPIRERSTGSSPSDISRYPYLPPASSSTCVSDSEEFIDALDNSVSSLSLSLSSTRVPKEDTLSQLSLPYDQQPCGSNIDSVAPNDFILDLAVLLALQPGSGLSGGLGYDAPTVPDMSSDYPHSIMPSSLALKNVDEIDPYFPQPAVDLFGQNLDSYGMSNFLDQLSLSGEIDFSNHVGFTGINFSSFLNSDYC